MESFKIKYRLTPIFLVILISMLFSCTKETKKEPQKIYGVSENSQNTGNPKNSKVNSNSQRTNPNSNYDIERSGDNVSSFRLDNQIINPEKTEGYVTKEGRFKKINIASYTNSEGYFFELFVPTNENIVGTHDLDKNGNRLLLNYKDNGLLTVYGSHFCKSNSGQITINAYDASKNIISGSFSTVVCNKGVVGKRGKKTIQFCEFKNVTLLAL